MTSWFVIVGVLLISTAMARSALGPLPVTTSMFYLAVGLALGPLGLDILVLGMDTDAALIEHVTEVAIIISLFTAGLKLRAPVGSSAWVVPFRLASGGMVLTVALVTVLGVVVLGLPLGAAVLLGGILAPTDPVLASDVQVEGPWDPDRLRFGLTGEAGLNDGTAFPFVMLGLGLLGAHELGDWGWRWLAADVLWAVFGGIAIGAACGLLVGRLVLYLREGRGAVGAEEFLALGLIALSYGAALWLRAYGFLAVFAAGVALREIERRATRNEPEPEPKAPRHLVQAVLFFNEQLDHLGEVLVVLLVGALLVTIDVPPGTALLVVLLILVVRPVAAGLMLIGTPTTRAQRVLTAWFGVRGIGSIYYLAYAVMHGLPEAYAAPMTAVTLAVVATSVVVHGVSVGPLMHFYTRRRERSATNDG